MPARFVSQLASIVGLPAPVGELAPLPGSDCTGLLLLLPGICKCFTWLLSCEIDRAGTFLPASVKRVSAVLM